MKLPNLGNKILIRFGALDDEEGVQLHREALAAYDKQVDAAKFKIAHNEKRIVAIAENAQKPVKDWVAPIEMKLKIEDKAIMFVELWWVRYIIAFLYIFIVPALRSHINGEGDKDGDDEDDEDDAIQALQFYQKFKKFKKS